MLHHERHKLLIVDDVPGNVPGNIRVLAEILKQAYEIIVATNGKEALVASKNLRPDLILLDVHMPGMNGFELAILSMPLRVWPVIFQQQRFMRQL